MVARQQAQFRQTAFQVLPRFDPNFFRSALGLSLVAAKEDVAADVADLQSLRDLNEALDIHDGFLSTSGRDRDPRL
jgi:hypothetical protein